MSNNNKNSNSQKFLKEYLKNREILVVGCGGVGSEVIKLIRIILDDPISNDANNNFMNSFKLLDDKIHLINNLTILDYDKIETTNLNRQFFFNKQDENKLKSKILSERIGCKYITKKIEEMNVEFLDKFNIVFSCLDNVSSRMELNYIFKSSKCDLLIDCGVEGMKIHVKIVNKSSSCLYCIKDLYKTENQPYLCSVTYNKSIDETNRNKALWSMIYKEKELNENFTDFNKIVQNFNKLAPNNLKTSEMEVTGLFYDIIPNIAPINSICASYAIQMLESNDFDFLYYDGTETPFLKKLLIDRDELCIVCN